MTINVMDMLIDGIKNCLSLLPPDSKVCFVMNRDTYDWLGKEFMPENFKEVLTAINNKIPEEEIEVYVEAKEESPEPVEPEPEPLPEPVVTCREDIVLDGNI